MNKEENLNGLAKLLLSFIAQDLIENSLTGKVIVIQKGSHDNINVSVRVLEETEKLISIEFKIMEVKNEPAHSRDVPKGCH